MDILNLTTTPLKRCTNCERELPATLEYFGVEKHGKYGLRSHCKACRKIEDKERYAADPQKSLAASRRWREANPERARTSSRESARKARAVYPERFRDACRRYMNSDPEKRRCEARARYARNIESRRLSKRVSEQKRRIERERSDVHHTPDDVRHQYALQKGKCHWCDKPVGDDYHVDHIIPLSKGGDNSARNICISCPTCNSSKGAKLPHEWSDRLF
jgi:5-methylcytosine-specific restriction endonuclease McrA